jgi:hypothetical protein
VESGFCVGINKKIFLKSCYQGAWKTELVDCILVIAYRGQFVCSNFGLTPEPFPMYEKK